MSVYVKGMEMPDDCRDCPFEMYYNNCGITKCRATGRDLAVDYKCIPYEGRADDCPLVAVPTPHGRLIDENTALDKLCDVGEAKTDKWERGMNFYDMQKGLSITPTVIEEEDE